jgi:UDP-N-acetylglucosamine transferase subunit ALG13
MMTKNVHVFATVGSELGFDRLVEGLDAWAGAHPEAEEMAQVGPSEARPVNMEWFKTVSPRRYNELMRLADVVVGHAGMGTILSGLGMGKPVVVMPRRADLGEHRNDHQLATVEHFGKLAGVVVAREPAELESAIAEALALEGAVSVSREAGGELLARLEAEAARADAARPILAVASGGGHWIQLSRCLGALDSQWLVVVTSSTRPSVDVDCRAHHVVPEASRWDKWGLIKQAWAVRKLVRQYRPGLVVSTGAAPGYWAMRFGSKAGARTVWLDSIANAGELSMSGRKAGKHADAWLTQWPHLAEPGGPEFAGGVVDFAELAGDVSPRVAAGKDDRGGR